jgi:hypothetical protein
MSCSVVLGYVKLEKKCGLYALNTIIIVVRMIQNHKYILLAKCSLLMLKLTLNIVIDMFKRLEQLPLIWCSLEL